ncbi:MAG: ATP-binding protein [Anaerolineales bacterium]|nr:ATP-binding protein [Anaerolineales bacterium]MCB9144215.1 ATP-binding protein [Anaerolineales bacterium]
MSLMFLPSQSKNIFVGREEQMLGFKSILEGRQKEWILHIPGEGGIGKTRLLEQYEKAAKEQLGDKLASTRIIDFYDTRHQTRVGLLDSIAEALEFDPDGDFFSESRDFQRLINSKGADYLWIQDHFEQVFDKFLAEYKSLLDQKEKVLILLDTCEEMKSSEDWLMEKFFAEVGELEKIAAPENAEEPPAQNEQESVRKTIIVIAGRKELDFEKYEEYAEAAWKFKLPLLTLEDIKDYFLNSPEISNSINEAGFESIHQRTGGRPLYVALVYDWLSNNIGTLDELINIEESSFAEELVGWVRRLDLTKKMTILYMAFAWRRMELSLLGELLGGLPEAQVKAIVDELINFSFVKYREIENGHFVVNLHDEMRKLINEHIWPREIASELEKPYPVVLDWYKRAINDDKLLKGKETPQNDRERALLSEDLYYRLRQDLKNGLEWYEIRFKNAIHLLDLDYCDMMNREVEYQKKQLPLSEHDKYDFRVALTAFRKEEYIRAGSIWHVLVQRPEINQPLKATTLMQLVELDSYTGNPQEAIHHAKDAESLYTELIKSEKKAPQKAQFKQELGQLYNNWGYACRVTDDYKQALDFYKMALKASGQNELGKKHKARVLNNMGYAYFRLGDVERARTYVGRALNIRRDMKIPYELGLGFNTFGQIMEDGGRIQNAVDLFTKAHQAFEQARSKRGMALAQINLGRMKRFINTYNDALAELRTAEKVMRRLHDQDNLIIILNEIGTTYREMGEWEDALSHLNESLRLSEKLEKHYQQSDTLDDIAVTYYKMAFRVEDASRNELIKKAREYALKSKKIAKENNWDFFVAKADIALGDLYYFGKKYNESFEHYFEATSLMAKAWASHKKASGFYQKRYEESLDKMQERLHTFEQEAGIEKTLHYVNQLLQKIDALPKSEKAAFSKMRNTLKATRETTKFAM